MVGKLSELTADENPAEDDIIEFVDISDGAADAANSKVTVRGFLGRTSMKTSVRAATTAAGTLATDFENGDTVDGVVLATGNRILIKDQSTGSENGIYKVNASGSPTRATDFDDGSDLIAQCLIIVQEGTVNGGCTIQCTTDDPITIGSTTLVFASRITLSTDLQLVESAAPAAPAANKVRIYNFNDGGIGHIRSKDQYGLIDQFGKRDVQRTRRTYSIEVGSDLSVTVTDILTRGTAFTIEGTVSNIVRDANGPYRKNFATAATTDTDAGPWSAASLWVTRLSDNPDFTWKFRLPSTSAQRTWIGFTELDHVSTDSTAGTHKFMLRCSSTAGVTGFTIVHSDGTSETVESQIQAADTVIHTIRLIGDNANTRWGYSFDGAAIVWITTNIPTSALDLIIQCQTRCTTNTAKNLELAWMEGTADQ